MFGFAKTLALASVALTYSAVSIAAPTNASFEARQYITSGTGQGTWYNTGLTSCGQYHSDSELIVAVSHLLYDVFPGAAANPNLNPVCGKQIQANYNGRSVRVTVADKCMGCALTDLDFTPTAFSQLADTSVGRLSGVTWSFV